MFGQANLKSHVLRRDEKGFMGIPFKRVLMAGMVGGIVFSFIRSLVGDMPGLIIGVALFVLTVVLTAPKGGIPRYQRILYGFRGNLMRAAFEQGNGIAREVCKLLDLDYEHLVVLDGDVIFKTPKALIEDESALKGWIFHSSAQGAPEGLQIVEKPVIKLAGLRNKVTIEAKTGQEQHERQTV